MNMKESLSKDKKINSEKLRIENKKMELRLQQLKLAMNKEKEDRLSNGIQSNWSTGSPGAILNYKPLSSSLNSHKKIKLKMLKDVMVTPKPTNNMKINVLRDIGGFDIMSSKHVLTTDLKEIDNIVNFRSCGQCEGNSAAVSCKECAEDYCPKCFAGFHLKGALRKHRSTPISTINNRVSIPSPLFKSVDLKNMSNTLISKRYKSSFENNEVKKNFFSINESKMESDESSKENDIPNYYDSSLADGNYNEEAASRHFQEAIYAWRNNTELSEPQHNMQKLKTVEHSTETVITKNGNKKLLSDLIQFTSSMTYAEQLLLRKHRNTQISSNNMKYITFCLTETNEIDILKNEKLLQSNLTASRANNFENAFKDNQNHVDFDCVYQLLCEADLIEGRKSSIQSQITIKDQSFLKIESLDSEDIQKYNEILTYDKLIQSESSNSNLDDFQIYKNNNLLDYKLQQNDNSTKECEISLSKLKNSRSLLNRNVFYTRPISGRKLTTRNDKGGKLTSKPSTLLNLLAKFDNYLYHNQTNEDISKVASKISYNFYKLSPNSWKPLYSLSNEVHNFNNPNDILSISSENANKDIEIELNKLNLLSDEINHTSVIFEYTKSGVGFLSKCNYSDGNELDEEPGELESINNFDSDNRKITLMSMEESEFTFHNEDQVDILIDSLEISNQCPNLIDSFDFELSQ